MVIVNLNGQTGETNINIENKQGYDTSRIESYYDKLGIYAYTIRKYRNLELKDKEGDTKLKFEPNGQTNLGLGFNYKWVGISAAFSFGFMNRNKEVYGETSRFDLQLNIFSRSFGASAYMQKYKGFYLENINDFQLPENSYPYLGDLESSAIGLDAFYFFNNKKFSYKAAFVRNEVQKKSAGGFILGGFFKLSWVLAPSGFVPPELPNDLHSVYDFNGYASYAFGVNLGYAYTFVFFKKKAFLNLSGVPGIGFRSFTIWDDVGEQEKVNDGTGNFTFRMALGYEGKRLYWGLATIAAMESFKYETVDISASTGQVKFYVGKRFGFGKKEKLQ